MSNNSDRPDQQEWLAQVSQRLDRAEQELDASVLADLRRIRVTALDQMPAPRRRWIPVMAMSAFASVVVLTAVLVLTPSRVAQGPAIDDISLLSSGEEIELYEQLDFYQWLEENINDLPVPKKAIEELLKQRTW